MRIPQLLPRVAQCSTAEPQLSVRFPWSVYLQHNLNDIDSVKELYLRSFGFSRDWHIHYLILGSACLNSSVFWIFQMVVASLCITTEMSSLLALSTLPWHCMAVSVKERFLGSSAGGTLSLHTDTSKTCRWFAPRLQLRGPAPSESSTPGVASQRACR